MSELFSAQPTAPGGKGSTGHTKQGIEERQVKGGVKTDPDLALVKGGELGALKTLSSLVQRQKAEGKVPQTVQPPGL